MITVGTDDKRVVLKLKDNEGTQIEMTVHLYPKDAQHLAELLNVAAKQMIQYYDVKSPDACDDLPR